MYENKHQPQALPYLFLTEMWERFGFYVVQGMLVLYMSKAFGFTDDTCYTIQGLFTALAYISPIIGGLLADRLLGFKTSIIWGGIFLSAGYALLALPFHSLFYFSLATIIVGNGLFKPNISSLLGALYEQGDPNRESGFTFFYIGINIGVLLAGLSSGFMQNHFGWNAGFALACLGLLLGLTIFSLGVKKFSDLKVNPLTMLPQAKRWIKMTVLAGALTIIFIVSQLLQSDFLAQSLFPALGASLIIFLLALALRQAAPYKQRMFMLTSLILSSIVFWMFFLQMFFSANLFIDRLVAKHGVPTTAFYTLESIFVILLGPIFAWSWSTLSINHKNPSSFLKFTLALVFVGLGFFILGLSTYFANSEHLINPAWVIAAYFFMTIGELLLSPIGLSAVTLLAPRHLVGMMMGVWFVAIGFGGEFAGFLAKLSSIPSNVTSLEPQIIIYRHAFFVYAEIAACIALALFISQLAVRFILNEAKTA
jgi:proton-dependent oligopeptide transporter, POT family